MGKDNQLLERAEKAFHKVAPNDHKEAPLLANIMLDPLDKELEKRGHKFARYADDFTILVKSQRAGERVLRSIISQYLQKRLKLMVNSTKSAVMKTSQNRFLGFTFKSGRIQSSAESLLKFKQKIRRLTNQNWANLFNESP